MTVGKLRPLSRLVRPVWRVFVPVSMNEARECVGIALLTRSHMLPEKSEYTTVWGLERRPDRQDRGTLGGSTRDRSDAGAILLALQ